jgi:hypothetical protein
VTAPATKPEKRLSWGLLGANPETPARVSKYSGKVPRQKAQKTEIPLAFCSSEKTEHHRGLDHASIPSPITSIKNVVIYSKKIAMNQFSQENKQK